MYKSRNQLMQTTKYHRHKGYNDTYEAATTLLFDDYLVMVEEAEKQGITVSNQLSNVIHKYIEDHRLVIEKEANKRLIAGSNKPLRATNNDYVCIYVPKDSIEVVN